MARRFISQLADREVVDEIFQASDKKLRPNRNGALYLQVELSDRTGSLSARIWNANDALYRSFDDGDFVRVEGTAQVYQGEMQMIATKITKASPASIDPIDFQPETPRHVELNLKKLESVLRGFEDPYLRAIAESFLMDAEFMRKFSRAPAGVKNHHAFVGGLVEHVCTLLEIVVRIADLYPMLRKELLLLGVFLHDAGKIDELSYERSFGYTDEGQLIGHVVMAVSMLEAKVREAEKLLGEEIPKPLVVHLKHLIVSHHGEYEYGAPKLPMTLEAVALWQLDNLDAKLHAFKQQMKDDPNTDSPWTLYNPQIGRKLFKSQTPGT